MTWPYDINKISCFLWYKYLTLEIFFCDIFSHHWKQDIWDTQVKHINIYIKEYIFIYSLSFHKRKQLIPNRCIVEDTDWSGYDTRGHVINRDEVVNQSPK